MLSMLKHPHPPADETLTLPPHLRPHHSLRFGTCTSSSPGLKILTLLWGPQFMPLWPPSTPLMPNPLSAAYHSYAQVQWPVGIHDERNQGDLLSGHLCQQVLGGNW
ncbi:hypothetical protein O181_049036 [Austropuccinia psidii MF-1]|uniref:Uncharacterized protein n=1 Tax=Austropuccinia psidii MF-1 TaxID=1389203 RepID=A0A9Q3HKZ4_9BASI|nr:hypothetical protein [Austropuccinia psidii MF-1]